VEVGTTTSPSPTLSNIGPDSSAVERTIDITTRGAPSGIPRRIAVWFHRINFRPSEKA
jgi:hypothetical protein